MICVKVDGGLGNQMFQYALGRALAENHKTNLALDISRLSKANPNSEITPRNLEIHIFNIKAKLINNDEVNKYKPMIKRIVNVLLINLGFGGIRSSTYFIENTNEFDESIIKISNNCYLAGYWQSHHYFQNIKTIISDDFIFPLIVDKKNKKILEKIKNTNSISVHIRRGDYSSAYHNSHGVLPLDYYQKAIEHFANKLKQPYFIIFSDNIEWVKNNLTIDYRNEFISWNTGYNSYIDMQLMSYCKHNIIANSSFSWWSAWLNNNPNKIIIAPKKWFKDETKNKGTCDLIPKTWIRL